MSKVARNARQVSRSLDALSPRARRRSKTASRSMRSQQRSARRLFSRPRIFGALPASLRRASGQPDPGRRALAAGGHAGREVVLVFQDINMRVKARVGLPAETTTTTSTGGHRRPLHRRLALAGELLSKHGRGMNRGSTALNLLTNRRSAGGRANRQPICVSRARPAVYAQVKEIRGKTATLRVMRDYTHAKNACGHHRRNREQSFH